MAKKRKVKSIKNRVKRTSSYKELFLETLIQKSEQHITDQGSSIDEFFKDQTTRLRKELEEMRKQ